MTRRLILDQGLFDAMAAHRTHCPTTTERTSTP